MTATGGMLIFGLGLGLLEPERGQGGEHAARAPCRPPARRGGTPVAALTYARAADTLVFVGETTAR